MCPNDNHEKTRPHSFGAFAERQLQEGAAGANAAQLDAEIQRRPTILEEEQHMFFGGQTNKF